MPEEGCPMKRRPSYTKEVKLEVEGLLKRDDKPAAGLAHELGIPGARRAVRQQFARLKAVCSDPPWRRSPGRGSLSPPRRVVRARRA